MLFNDHESLSQLLLCHHLSNMVYDPCCRKRSTVVMKQYHQNVLNLFYYDTRTINCMCQFCQHFGQIKFKYMWSIKRYLQNSNLHKMLENAVNHSCHKQRNMPFLYKQVQIRMFLFTWALFFKEESQPVEMRK